MKLNHLLESAEDVRAAGLVVDRLCIVCRGVFVEAGMCEECKHFDLELEGRRLLGEFAVRPLVAGVRPTQPRADVGVSAYGNIPEFSPMDVWVLLASVFGVAGAFAWVTW